MYEVEKVNVEWSIVDKGELLLEVSFLKTFFNILKNGIHRQRRAMYLSSVNFTGSVFLRTTYCELNTIYFLFYTTKFP